ncbi:MAG: hypothetical protein ACXVW5_30700 [Solirubrobacteraceae bacterium]
MRHVDDTRIVVETDSGLVRELPAAYVSDHVEHAYCLTGHGMQGGTVEQAVVVADPHDLSAGWSYTALSRARGETHLLLSSKGIHDDADRGELGPAERIARPDRDELLRRVERRMRHRDDEDLAIEQLPPPGYAGGPDLASSVRFSAVRPQERGAAMSDEPESTTRNQLSELRDRLARLETALSALPLRSLDRFDQVDAELREISGRRTQRVDELASLDASRRGSWRRAPDNNQTAFLRAAIASDDRAIEDLLATRGLMMRELGEPDHVRSERAALDAEHGRCRRDFDDLLDTYAARECVAERVWASTALGHRPPPGRNRETWDGAVQRVARYRLEHGVHARDSAIGCEPVDQFQRREWANAQQTLERAQRNLRVSTPERTHGLDHDFG